MADIIEAVKTAGLFQDLTVIPGMAVLYLVLFSGMRLDIEALPV